ncbi:hypothetical protein LUX12_10400 [Streptomyces somaliensis]|nr:hypothetical protein [Streptomyces somaliensis]MCP9974499.1 hypothetical protein [Streptomyces somaliensis]
MPGALHGRTGVAVALQERRGGHEQASGVRVLLLRRGPVDQGQQVR